MSKNKRAFDIDIQKICRSGYVPSDEHFEAWVNLVFDHQHAEGSVVIRLVDESESQQLNHQYRQKDTPTNVLSFPFESPEILKNKVPLHLGDLVVCVSVVNQEAMDQNKPVDAHWAHILIHGLLHLLGYDHVNKEDATTMEVLEVLLLAQLKIPNPYEEVEK